MSTCSQVSVVHVPGDRAKISRLLLAFVYLLGNILCYSGTSFFRNFVLANPGTPLSRVDACEMG